MVDEVRALRGLPALSRPEHEDGRQVGDEPADGDAENPNSALDLEATAAAAASASASASRSASASGSGAAMLSRTGPSSSVSALQPTASGAVEIKAGRPSTGSGSVSNGAGPTGTGRPSLGQGQQGQRQGHGLSRSPGLKTVGLERQDSADIEEALEAAQREKERAELEDVDIQPDRRPDSAKDVTADTI